MDYQWYPGHMTRARRMMEENIRLVDLVIELVDARIPLSSRNPDIDSLCQGKGRIVLLCKADLADPTKTAQFEEFFRSRGMLAFAVDARDRKSGDLVRRYVQEACRKKLERDRARGIVGRPLRAMVAGIPNVGKSTFINSLAGRASTKTGNKPGVTRGKQWIRMGGGLELLDTPGILWPKFENQEIGMRLALAGAIREEILDRQELAVWLLNFLNREYPGLAEKKYLSRQSQTEDMEAVAEACAEAAEPGMPNDLPTESQEGVSREPNLSAEFQEGVSGEPDLPTESQEGVSGEPASSKAGFALLLEIARARRLLMKGGEPDAERAAAMLVDDCKNGRIGRISLDSPQDGDALEEGKTPSAPGKEREKTGAGRKAAGKDKGASGGMKKDRGRAGNTLPGKKTGASGKKMGASGKKTGAFEKGKKDRGRDQRTKKKQGDRPLKRP